jgi:hypothetical protein
MRSGFFRAYNNRMDFDKLPFDEFSSDDLPPDKLPSDKLPADKLQQISERDQLWASLRGLTEEIRRLGQGDFDGSERQMRLAILLARIVAAEMAFRLQDAEET